MGISLGKESQKSSISHLPWYVLLSAFPSMFLSTDIICLQAREVKVLKDIIMPGARSGEIKDEGEIFTISHKKWSEMSDEQQRDIFEHQHVHVVADETTDKRPITGWDQREELARFLYLKADRHVTGMCARLTELSI